MENPTTNVAAAVPLPASAGAPGAAPVGQPDPGKLAALRAKWREKYHRLKAARLGRADAPGAGAAPAPPPGTMVSLPAGAPGAGPALPGGAGPVPWSADALKPLLAQIVPLWEAHDVATLSDLAARLGPQALALVQAKARWPVASKIAIIDGGAAVAAKYLNKFSISAEYQPEVTLGIAVCSVVWGRLQLMNDLKALVAEAERKKRQAAAQPAPAPQVKAG